MKKRLALAAAGTLLMCAPASAAEQVITFEDLTTLGCCNNFPANYQGFGWDNIFVVTPPPNTGYANTIVGDYGAFMGDEITGTMTRASAFDFLGGRFGSGWNNGVSVQMTGYRGSDVVYDVSFIVNATSATTYNVPMLGIDKLTFHATGGTPDPIAAQYGGPGTYLTFDNFRFAAAGVPEPTTWATMIVGFGAIAGALRRRRQKPRPSFA